MNLFGDTGFGGTWLQLLSTPIGGILLALLLIRVAVDRMPSAKTRNRPGRRKARPRPISRALAPLAGLITLLWLFMPGYKIYTGMTSSALTRGIAWSIFDDVLTALVLMAWVAVGYAVGHDRHHAREAIRLDLQLDQIKTLSPSGFEAFVAELFRSQGYQAEVVGGEGDHGVDLVLANPHGERELVQCKRWDRRWIGEPAVRDFYGSLRHDQHAVRGYIVTTSFFSRSARAWAEGKPIDLVDGPELAEAARKIAGSSRLPSSSPAFERARG